MNNKDFNLEEKDIFELFNEIKVEESEFDDMDDEVSAIQKEKIKKNLNKRIKGQRNLKVIKHGSIAAAIGLISIIGIGTASPAFAKNIPILNSITQTLNEKFGGHGDYAKYSQVVNKSATDNGVTLTVNEVIADDSKIILGYTIKSNKKIEDLEVVGLSKFLQINGKHLGSGGGAVGNYVDDCTFLGSEEIHTALPQDSNKYDISLNVDSIMDIKGKWDIAFTASKDELVKKSEVFKPNKKVDLKYADITVDKVVRSPIDISIFITGNYKNKTLESPASGVIDEYIAFGDNGVELIQKGGSTGAGTIGDKKFNDELYFQNQKRTPKYLTLVPCKITASRGGGVSVDLKTGKETPIVMQTKEPNKISKIIDGVYPIELSQGSMGKVTIKEIKTENNKTTVKYTVKGKAPYFQAQNLWIEDSNGKEVDFKSYDIRKDEQKPNEFIREFKALDPNKKYTIFTNDFSNVEFREDLKFRIDLNK
jgi:hypothetical protein